MLKNQIWIWKKLMVLLVESNEKFVIKTKRVEFEGLKLELKSSA